MKLLYLHLLTITLFTISCSKDKEIFPPIVINPSQPVISQPPVFTSQFNAVLDGSSVSIHSILNTRGNGSMDITGMNGKEKIVVQVRRITQTGHNTGLILIGFYNIIYSAAGKEGGWVTYYSKDERLGIYNNTPLTDSIVSGYFSATIAADSNFTNPQKLNGEFKVRY